MPASELAFLIPVPLSRDLYTLNAGSFLPGDGLRLLLARPCFLSAWSAFTITRDRQSQLKIPPATSAPREFEPNHALENSAPPSVLALDQRGCLVCHVAAFAPSSLSLNKNLYSSDAVSHVGMIEFDGILILIGYATVVATTLSILRLWHCHLLGSAGNQTSFCTTVFRNSNLSTLK